MAPDGRCERDAACGGRRGPQEAREAAAPGMTEQPATAIDRPTREGRGRRSRGGVVPRRLVMFRRFELPGVPMSRRMSALRLAIAEWSPYPDWLAAAAWLDAT